MLVASLGTIFTISCIMVRIPVHSPHLSLLMDGKLVLRCLPFRRPLRPCLQGSLEWKYLGTIKPRAGAEDCG